MKGFEKVNYVVTVFFKVKHLSYLVFFHVTDSLKFDDVSPRLHSRPSRRRLHPRRRDLWRPSRYHGTRHADSSLWSLSPDAVRCERCVKKSKDTSLSLNLIYQSEITLQFHRTPFSSRLMFICRTNLQINLTSP